MYDKAIAYLNSLIDFERADRGVSMAHQRAFRLDRMRALLELLGEPHRSLRCVHVGGTKGKGSVCAFVDSILRKSGYRVGLYTQPGLVDLRERIMIDRRMIPKGAMVQLVDRLKPCVERISKEELGEVTYFEAMTAIALDHYAREKVDQTLLEVGMGGRLDATNVVIPAVCAITAIGFDHALNLGHTLKKIAGEKAGIVKNGVPVVSAPQPEEAATAIRSFSAERNARFIEVGKDIRFTFRSRDANHQIFDVAGLRNFDGLEIALKGGHQVINAVVAVAIAEVLRDTGISIPEDSVRHGLKETTWPGRLQVIGKDPTIVMDGAHTIESARGLVQSLKEGFSYDRLILVFGIATDKDISGVWRVLERCAEVAFLTGSSQPKAAEPLTISQMVCDTEVTLHVVESPIAAFESACSIARPDDLICVTGSLYLVGDILRHLGIAAQEEG